MASPFAFGVVYWLGSAALVLELAVLLMTLCFRGSPDHRIAKSIYAFIGAALSLMIDLSFGYLSPITEFIAQRLNPSYLGLLIVIIVMTIGWYICISVAVKLFLPVYDSAKTQAILASIVAALLASVVRILSLVNIEQNATFLQPVATWGLTLYAGIFVSSLLYFANQLLKPKKVLVSKAEESKK